VSEPDAPLAEPSSSPGDGSLAPTPATDENPAAVDADSRPRLGETDATIETEQPLFAPQAGLATNDANSAGAGSTEGAAATELDAANVDVSDSLAALGEAATGDQPMEQPPDARVAEIQTIPANQSGLSRSSPGEGNQFRTWVAVLIAVTSVLGAGAAWQAANTAGTASSFDSIALQETSFQQQLLSNWTSVIDEDLRNRALYLQYTQAAKSLSQDADALRSSDPTLASELDVQASAQSRLADARAVQYRLIAPWTDADKNDSDLRQQWLEERQQDDPDLRTLQPARTIAHADSLHQQANQMLFLVALFVAALVFLTMAQFARKETRRLFAAAGIAVIVVAILLWPVVALL